jgi:hypothetical protein
MPCGWLLALWLSFAPDGIRLQSGGTRETLEGFFEGSVASSCRGCSGFDLGAEDVAASRVVEPTLVKPWFQKSNANTEELALAA